MRISGHFRMLRTNLYIVKYILAYTRVFLKVYTGYFITPDGRQSKTLILSTNVDKNS